MTNEIHQTESRVVDELVVRARCDRDAFGRLYERIYPPVFRYCVRRTGSRSLAEDITSTVFLSVARTIATFPGETFEDFRRWVFAIATNEMKATFRKSARREALLVDAVQSGRLPCQTSGSSASVALEADGLQAAIMRLPERDQIIITMRFFSELPYDDIGRILDISPGAARTAATRALDRIRKDMGR
jgi:RNA polymerase sigma-70 factor, ECF subfamily